jgi:hypothetical protein
MKLIVKKQTIANLNTQEMNIAKGGAVTNKTQAYSNCTVCNDGDELQDRGRI